MDRLSALPPLRGGLLALLAGWRRCWRFGLGVGSSSTAFGLLAVMAETAAEVSRAAWPTAIRQVVMCKGGLGVFTTIVLALAVGEPLPDPGTGAWAAGRGRDRARPGLA